MPHQRLDAEKLKREVTAQLVSEVVSALHRELYVRPRQSVDAHRAARICGLRPHSHRMCAEVTTQTMVQNDANGGVCTAHQRICTHISVLVSCVNGALATV